MKVDRDFRSALASIIDNDDRYAEGAYMFLREALDYTNTVMEIQGHVTGKELLEGTRRYVLGRYGPMAGFVLSEWGVTCCEDFGNIVFNMVGASLLGKTEDDSIDDFKGGYDFGEAFESPFK